MAERGALDLPGLQRSTLSGTKRRLDPIRAAARPARLLGWLGTLAATALWADSRFAGEPRRSLVALAVAAAFWCYVLCASALDARAAVRRRRAAESLRRARGEAQVRVLAEPDRNAPFSLEFPAFLESGDYVLVEAGGIVPADGRVVRGSATVDDGPTADDLPLASHTADARRPEVLAGGRVHSGWIVLEVVSAAGESRLEQRIRELEGAGFRARSGRRAR